MCRAAGSAWFRALPSPNFRGDVIAGLTTSAVVIPKAMAIATIAGLPVETGLYVALVPMLVYALCGSSRVLSVSSTSTIAILVAAELKSAVPGGDSAALLSAAATLALLVGAVLLLAGLLRLGFLASFISDPVLAGFKAGIGLVIVVDQLPKLLGVHIEKAGFFRDLGSLGAHVTEARLPTLLLGLALLALLLGLKRFWPRVPAALVAVVVGIGACVLLDLGSAGVALTAEVPSGLPHPALPQLAWGLLPGALGIALMSFIESIAAARAFARHGDPRPEPNRELCALGLANLAGAFIHALPAGGGTSQTAVNAGAGARSQTAELVGAAIALCVLLFLAPLLARMPQVTLAAIVIVTSAPLIDPRELFTIRRTRHMEFRWALCACAGVVFLGTLQGILIAVAISILGLMRQATQPPVYALGRKPGTDVFRPRSSAHPEDEVVPGLAIVRVEGRLNFANMAQAGEQLWALIRAEPPRVLLLDCGAIPDFEYTALKGLTGFEERLREAGITLWLAGLNPEPLRMIEQAPLGRTLGHERMFFNCEQAFERYRSRPS